MNIDYYLFFKLKKTNYSITFYNCVVTSNKDCKKYKEVTIETEEYYKIHRNGFIIDLEELDHIIVNIKFGEEI